VDWLLAAERILPVALPLAGLPLWLGSDGAGMVVGLAGLAAAGRFGPRLLAANAAQRRLQALARGVPDVVDLLVICADSGLGLAAELARCGRELAPAQRRQRPARRSTPRGRRGPGGGANRDTSRSHRCRRRP
jgi:pilus assembly protein TadC